MSLLRTLNRLPRHPASALRQFSTTPSRLDFSRVQIIGRIGTEPEISQASNGSSVTKYAVASTIGYGDKQSTQWHKVIAFGYPTPERLTKGARIFLDGDLQLNTYEAEDGKKHTHVTVKQRSVNILSRPQGAGEGEGAQSA
ncbi:ssDNA-binding protein, mitochondrial [Orbilia oligospora]|uniref:SsDNA-binding protein, mitochondrial n=1 Tax=Orbilia oligospora TaxID=2813651 RepID=A0A6G1MKL3_ORBOL|nr:ssDNA-binding protein, mitochondrial [Orbilia oligospora]KAF3212320.1 ssDNA-binding protein, mitochondrial [Orbilia oligospora]KAF3212486.1 ssDNA-binding protein, mitochondrial [Orbilia oligospora]KAF3261080.1 ssDNA-binding protein, mitochondrial [Orbilia oligospora]